MTESYRIAYEEATAELGEIAAEFDRLQARKQLVEELILSFQPLFEPVDARMGAIVPAVPMLPEPAPFLVQPLTAGELPAGQLTAGEQQADADPSLAAESGSTDPFQRRIDNALKRGFGSRDSKILPRTLSGLLSRA